MKQLPAASAPFTGDERALSEIAGALSTFEALGDLWGVGTALHVIGRVRVIYERFDDAGDIFERALATVEEVGDDVGIALSLINLACVRLAAGDHRDAREFIRRSLEHMRGAGIVYASGDVLDVLAQIEHADGRHEQAVELLGAADALRVRLHSPLWGPAVERHQRFVNGLRELLGAAVFAELYDRGQVLGPGEVEELAARIATAAAEVSG